MKWFPGSLAWNLLGKKLNVSGGFCLGIILLALLVLSSCDTTTGSSDTGSPDTPKPPPDIWDGSKATGFAEGDGTEYNPYLISTVAQLAFLAQETNAGNSDYNDKYYTLIADLDLNNHEWTAIGTAINSFKGGFDGDGHTISNLKINKLDIYFQGLFGYIDDAGINNLDLVDVDITGEFYVGGIAGCVSGDSNITNCTSSGEVSGTTDVGGIAGWAFSNSTITNCFSTGTVSGTNGSVGGIAGSISSNSSITNCASSGEVGGARTVGGIVGWVSTNSHITNCASSGEVSGARMVGGIVGLASSNSNITNCAALNPGVTAIASDAGRIAGFIDGISNTFTGNVAWAGMTLTDATVSEGSEKDGTGISKTQIQDGSGLPASLKTDPWTHRPGKLPILSGLTGRQDDTLPAHLQ
jgi:hypothetical protein